MNFAAPAALDNVTLARLLPQLDLIESWCAAIRSRAMLELESGAQVPGWKLVQGRRGARRWTDENTAAQHLSALLPDPYERKLLSPAAAEKQLAKEDREKLSALISQSEGKPTLAPESDPRPALVVFD